MDFVDFGRFLNPGKKNILPLKHPRLERVILDIRLGWIYQWVEGNPLSEDKWI